MGANLCFSDVISCHMTSKAKLKNVFKNSILISFSMAPLASLMSICLSTGMQVENKSFFNLFLFLGWKWFLKEDLAT